MSDSIKFIDDLLTVFDRELPCSLMLTDTSVHKEVLQPSNPSTNAKTADHSKHKNGKIQHAQPSSHDNPCSSSSSSPSSCSSTSSDAIKDTAHKTETKCNHEDEQKQGEDEKEVDELSEEEALRLAMEMSMTEEDHQLVAQIEKEIHESQRHLSNWFRGSFDSVKDKNRAWCDFCRRLHHQFEMYRIEQGVIQPLQYQFFIQFIAMMYGTMPNSPPKKSKKKKSASQLQLDSDDAQFNIDQHKIRNIVLLSADDDAIKYLRFKQGVSKKELHDAVYAKFQSLALDPTCPDEWKFNHVMFVRSAKAPNGLLWTKWHMQ